MALLNCRFLGLRLIRTQHSCMQVVLNQSTQPCASSCLAGCNDGGMGGALPLLKNGKIKEPGCVVRADCVVGAAFLKSMLPVRNSWESEHICGALAVQAVFLHQERLRPKAMVRIMSFVAARSFSEEIWRGVAVSTWSPFKFDAASGEKFMFITRLFQFVRTRGFQ